MTHARVNRRHGALHTNYPTLLRGSPRSRRARVYYFSPPYTFKRGSLPTPRRTLALGARSVSTLPLRVARRAHHTGALVGPQPLRRAAHRDSRGV